MGAFFAVLKFILLAVLVLVVLIVLITAIILFSSIKYNAFVEHDENMTNYNIKATWLLRLFEFRMIKNADEEKRFFRIAWRKIVDYESYDTKKDDEKPLATEKKERTVTEKTTDVDIESENTEASESRKVDDETDENDSNDHENKSDNKLKNIVDKLKFIYNYENKEEIFAQCIKLIKGLLKSLKPDKFDLYCEFGFDTPDKTGIALGIISIIKGMIDSKFFDISVKGNFEEKKLNLTLNTFGKLSIWLTLWPFIIFVISKPIWAIIMNRLFKKNSDERTD
ncbi:hypothetical protein LJB89_01115 [Tyzzerella sp. OttesenSCG-928-J15]|nr:hypothetical protein [Tyzzerella sp. OttesenSCG-928-J15]